MIRAIARAFGPKEADSPEATEAVESPEATVGLEATDGPARIVSASAEASVECCICFGQYESVAGSNLQPVVLPCGHSICRGCMLQLHHKRCPICRWQMHNEPPLNHSMIELLEKRVELTVSVGAAISAAHDTLVKDRERAEANRAAAVAKAEAVATKANHFEARCLAESKSAGEANDRARERERELAAANAAHAAAIAEMKSRYDENIGHVDKIVANHLREVSRLNDIIKMEAARHEGTARARDEHFANFQRAEERRRKLQEELERAKAKIREHNEWWEDWCEETGASRGAVEAVLDRLGDTIGELSMDVHRLTHERDEAIKARVKTHGYLTNADHIFAQQKTRVAFPDDQCIPPDCYPIGPFNYHDTNFYQLTTLEQLAVVGREYNKLAREHAVTLSENKGLAALVEGLRMVKGVNVPTESVPMEGATDETVPNETMPTETIPTPAPDEAVLAPNCDRCDKSFVISVYVYSVLLRLRSTSLEKLLGEKACLHDQVDALIETLTLRQAVEYFTKHVNLYRNMKCDTDRAWRPISMQIVRVRLGTEITEGKINEGVDDHGKYFPHVWF